MPAIYRTVDEGPPALPQGSNTLADVPLADILPIPPNRIISIEHPCIVRNLDKGLTSLGGEPRIKHVLEHRVGDSLLNPQKPQPEPELGVSLRPDDPFAAKMASTGVDTRNVLMKVTVPRRTGRKRKRGSDDPYTEHPDHRSTASITAPEMLKRLRDNKGKYVIEPVGMVLETHRFRGLPDYQTKSGDLPIFQELSSHVLQPTWSLLKDFNVDPTVGLPTMTAFPGPPTFASTAQPYRYEYAQAAGVRFSRDAQGNIKSTNLQAPPRKLVKAVPPDIEEVPQGPPAHLKAHNPHGTFLPRIIKELEDLLEERPLVTRRVVLNRITQHSDTLFREATQWVGYNFTAGPWRDTLIKYGVDPRKDPAYRKYQTLMFQLDKRWTKAVGEKNERWSRSFRNTVDYQRDDNASTYIFDGKSISPNGKTWQICDITDPVLKRILDTEELAETCDIHSYGWYLDGTIAKARMIMREKIEKLFEHEEQPHEFYDLIATMPEKVDTFNFEGASIFFANHPMAARATTFATEVRNMARNGHKVYLDGTVVRAAHSRGRPSANAVDEAPNDEETLFVDGDMPAAEEPIHGDLDEGSDDEGVTQAAEVEADDAVDATEADED